MASFKDFVRSKGVLTEAQYKKILEASMESRSSTFYSALFGSGMLSEDVVVRYATEFFQELKTINDPFRCKIDFNASLKVMPIEKIVDQHEFAVKDPETGELVFVIRDPKRESTKNAATIALGVEPKFALITNAQYNVFAQYQIKPKLIQLRSEEVSDDNQSNRKTNHIEELEATAAQKLLDGMLHDAIERRASDLHIRAMGSNESDRFVPR